VERVEAGLSLQLCTCLAAKRLELLQQQSMLLSDDAGHVDPSSSAHLGKQLLMLRTITFVSRYRLLTKRWLLITKVVLEDLADMAVEPGAVLH
jgi:hypothetical protein